jgi:(1->4)-alpha-D-glucan 1-alpha-D-glucosylmutase
VPGLWSQLVADWQALCPPPDPATGLFLWQNMFGVWPRSGHVDQNLRERLHAYAEKVVREAHLHTSWIDPDDAFEKAVHTWVNAVIDGPVATGLTELLHTLPSTPTVTPWGRNCWPDRPRRSRHLSGHRTLGGQPRRPDNRRPVDYAARRAALNALRTRNPGGPGGVTAAPRPSGHLPVRCYTALPAEGDRAEHAVAFGRGADGRRSAGGRSGCPNRLGSTTLTLPAGAWRDCLTDADHRGTVAARTLFSAMPVALLERTDA